MDLRHIDATDFALGLSCASTRLCVAVDDAGNVLTSSDPADGPAWHSAAVDPGHQLRGVSCPSTRFCVVVAMLVMLVVWKLAS